MPSQNSERTGGCPNRALQDVLEEQVGGRHFSHLLDAAAGDAAAARRLLLAGTRIDRITAVDREVDREATVESVNAAAARTGSGEAPVVHVVESDLVHWLGPNRSPVREGAAGNAGSGSESGSGETRFDACVIASSLHHLPRYERELERLVHLLRVGCCAKRGGYLIVWEPIRSVGSAAALHEIKAAVDRACGILHRSPFHRETLERTLVALEPLVVWSHRELVRPWRSELTYEEYRAAIDNTAEYLALVQQQRALYSALQKRLATLPSRPDQRWGEPHLYALGRIQGTGGRDRDS